MFSVVLLLGQCSLIQCGVGPITVSRNMLAGGCMPRVGRSYVQEHDMFGAHDVHKWVTTNISKKYSYKNSVVTISSPPTCETTSRQEASALNDSRR